MKKLIAFTIFALSIPSISAQASDSSPYVVGQWNLEDRFKDFQHDGPSIDTHNSAFVFLNPTALKVTLEYAFFAPDGTFCGCDRDTLNPNGRVRYTMLAEAQGGQFSKKLCPNQTDGMMKSIVFVSAESIGKDGALQSGEQIRINGQERTESDLNAVPVNETTIHEMNLIHQKCVKFIGS